MENENLDFQAIKRLQKILDTKHQIHGKGNFPTIEVEPRRLIEVIWNMMRQILTCLLFWKYNRYIIIFIT